MGIVRHVSFEQAVFLFPLLLLAIASLGIIIERVYRLFFAFPLAKQDQFLATVRDLVLDKNTSDAVALCESHKASPAATVIRDGLARSHQSESFIEHGLEMAVGNAAQKIQSRLPYLATIANVSTLTGLCGTVMGLIRCFGATAEMDAHKASLAMTTGISQAMTSTLAGLAIAVLCVLVYSVLMSRSKQLLSDLNNAAVQTMDMVKESKIQHYAAEAIPARQASARQ